MHKRRVAAGAVKKKFPEGDCYEELLMEIVDKNSAHVPPKGGIGKYWTNMIIAHAKEAEVATKRKVEGDAAK